MFHVSKQTRVTYQHYVVVHTIHLKPLHLVQVVHLSLCRCQPSANTQHLHAPSSLVAGIVSKVEPGKKMHLRV